MTQQQEIMPVAIEDKMKESYLNYSLSVIISRALPDVRDGLKPVHRRILYATKDLGLSPDKPHKKSARIVGEVLGKYHPHGDAAVYNAMVRMAQNFSQRYKLIDGHGNFGSIDGDSAAAMRYTEARLAPLSEDILSDIKKNTVEFIDNFDGSLQEPTVLPSRLPNLLINGSNGIAVGMSTDIPPHNLTEVISGLNYLLENEDCNLEELMKLISGPDFPTGGKIIGDDEIKKAYRTGKGRIILRAKTKIEKKGRNTQRIVVTEIPYQLRKAKLIEEMADNVKKGKVDNVSDIRDESDRDGLRIVIDLKSKANSNIILNRLYKYTSLQTSYRINMLALVNQRPEVMNLKTILQHFLNFRREVITKRTEFELNKAQERKHILIGLKKAIDNLDQVIAIIRKSRYPRTAKTNLQKELKVTERQAEAILNMKLQRLVSLEIKKITDEVAELKEKIDYLNSILNKKDVMNSLIKEELNEVQEEYGDNRKTEIIADESKAELDESDLIKDEDIVISFSHRKYLKRTNDLSNVRSGKRDYVTHVFTGTTRDDLLFFTNTGQVHILKTHQIPEHHGLSTGDPLNNYLKLPIDEEIVDIILLNNEVKERYITITTEQGLVKKTVGKEYETTVSSIKAINLNEDDQVIGIEVTDGEQNLLLGTKQGQTIHFNESSVSDTGRNTKGSKGISLSEGDKVISFDATKEDDYVIALDPQGKGKRTKISEYKLQNRNGKGLQTLSSDDYELTQIITATKDETLLCITENGALKELPISKITDTKRVGRMYSQLKLENEKLEKLIKLPKLENND
ncbi:DNA gyrase subunit A [Selenihalanaerobacter shriftii]|uniref:DNA topoisomerase (ATP-hydrolyzing) n=1 Tax=Selenihalanaerobacter shriftii TaxID=142842 RepID=A0A1T4JJ65_9FIRM|nr:DNA gyrase subunit A [Selenihalanaerobacter shriftii]SJZ30191.1 DNA gyrase subunit A [Selenihalanaerobacter shriftii]